MYSYKFISLPIANDLRLWYGTVQRPYLHGIPTLTFILEVSSSYSTGRMMIPPANRMASVRAAVGTRLTVKYLQQFLGILSL